MATGTPQSLDAGDAANPRPADDAVTRAARPAEDAGNAADAAGVAVSLACGIHCLLTPILLLFLPTLGEAFHRPVVHRTIALAVTAIAAWALWRGYRRHGHATPLAFGLAGLAAVWTALLLPHDAHAHEHFHIPAGTLITMLGSVLLITGHVLNIRACRCCTPARSPV